MCATKTHGKLTRYLATEKLKNIENTENTENTENYIDKYNTTQKKLLEKFDSINILNKKYLDCNSCGAIQNNNINKINRQTLITDPPADICPICPPIDILALPGILQEFFGIFINQAYKDYAGYSFIEAPNGIVINPDRLLNAYNKFSAELPGDNLSSYIGVFVQSIFQSVSQGTQPLFSSIFFTIIIQAYVSYAIIISILWIYKILSPGIAILWLVIGLIAALISLTVLVVEAGRSGLVISNSVDKILNSFSGTLRCAVNSGFSCYIGANCCCPFSGNTNTFPCGNTSTIVTVFGSLVINKNSGNKEGVFYFIYTGPNNDSSNPNNFSNGTISITTVFPVGGGDAVGSVSVTLPAGNYHVSEIFQAGWITDSINPVDGNVFINTNTAPIPITFKNHHV